jgi:hypothetical protein
MGPATSAIRGASAAGCHWSCTLRALVLVHYRNTGLEVEVGDDRCVVGLGILTFDSECGGLVVEDLVVDF